MFNWSSLTWIEKVKKKEGKKTTDKTILVLFEFKVSSCSINIVQQASALIYIPPHYVPGPAHPDPNSHPESLAVGLPSWVCTVDDAWLKWCRYTNKAALRCVAGHTLPDPLPQEPMWPRASSVYIPTDVCWWSEPPGGQQRSTEERLLTDIEWAKNHADRYIGGLMHAQMFLSPYKY